MSWVRRMPPGDPAYFCDCPPCPFCFEWVEEEAGDAPRARKRERSLKRTDASDSAGGERRMVRQLLLPVLTGIAFVLTVGITMRHQNPPSAPDVHSAALVSPAALAPPVAQGHGVLPQPQAPAAAAKPPPAPVTASQPPPAPSPDPADAATSEERPLPVRVSFVSSPEAGVTVRLHNGTEAALDIKATAVDRSSGSQSMVAVNVPPLTTIDLTGAGLVAEHGYQLRVESPGYEAREMLVQ